MNQLCLRAGRILLVLFISGIVLHVGGHSLTAQDASPDLSLDLPLMEIEHEGAIGGVVFFDNDGDGEQGDDENGLYQVQVTLRGIDVERAVLTDGDGRFEFGELAPGIYLLIESDPPGAFSVSANEVKVEISAEVDDTVYVSFADAFPFQACGEVWIDADLDGQFGFAEDTLDGSVIDLIRDVNGNGVEDEGDIVTSSTPVLNGFYRVEVRHGLWLIVERNPAGYISNTPDLFALDLSRLPDASGGVCDRSFGNIPEAVVEGALWLDSNGDGLFSDGEEPLPGVELLLFTEFDGDGADEVLRTAATRVQTGKDGRFRIGALHPDMYVLDLDGDSLPANLIRTDGNGAVPIALGLGETAHVDFTFAKLATVDPKRVPYWRKALRKGENGDYSAAQLQAFVDEINGTSALYSEVLSIPEILGPSANRGQWERAQRQTAALWLNIVSGRLHLHTQLDLGDLSSAATVGALLAEAETTLLDPAATRRTVHTLKKAVRSVNRGEGIVR